MNQIPRFACALHSQEFTILNGFFNDKDDFFILVKKYFEKYGDVEITQTEWDGEKSNIMYDIFVNGIEYDKCYVSITELEEYYTPYQIAEMAHAALDSEDNTLNSEDTIILRRAVNRMMELQKEVEYLTDVMLKD